MIDIILCLFVSMLGAVLYLAAGAARGDFVLDDGLIMNAVARFLPHMPDQQRVTWREYFQSMFLPSRMQLFRTYQRDANAHGTAAEGWIWTNIAVHAACIAAVYALCRCIATEQGAALGAMAFAFHPKAVSAVCYIAGRSSSLCALWYFLALIALIAGAWPLTVLFFVFARSCKEEALALPLAAAVCWWYLL